MFVSQTPPSATLSSTPGTPSVVAQYAGNTSKSKGTP
jgi:hypothetical protein